MFRMAVGHSDDIDLDDALATVFDECDAALDGARPCAGLLLASWDADHRAMVDSIRGHYPGIELAGTTSLGEMSSVLGFSEDSVGLALFASDAVDITAGLGRDVTTDPVGAVRSAVADARSRTAQAPSLCVAMPTVAAVEASVIIDALRAELGPDVPIFGGGAAPQDATADPRDRRGEGRQIVGDVVTEGAIAILLISGPLAYSFGVDTGWRGVGPRATITQVSDAGVVEIDGRPAIDFYERYLGIAAPAIANPVAVFETPDADRCYLRTPIAYDRETGCILFFGAIPEGATVQLTLASTEEIFDGARASIGDALASFPAGRTPEAALVYSCATRRFLLGTRVAGEIDVVRSALGAATPVAGLYCMGEIAPQAAGERSRFHNATLVSILLGSA
jgi:hypothetical protein